MKFLAKNDHFLPVTVAFFFCVLLLFNIKSMLFLVGLYGIYLFWVNGMKINRSILLLTIAVIFIEKGIRDWHIIVVPPGKAEWIVGYTFYFGLALKVILVATLLLLHLRKIFTRVEDRKTSEFQFGDSLVALFTFFSVISTIVADDFNLALLGFVRLFSGVFLYFYVQEFIRQTSFKKHFFIILSSMLLLLGAVGSMQFFAQSSQGLFLEDSNAFSFFGYLTTDGTPLFRSSGLLGHPTFFGSFLSLLIPLSLTQIIKLYGKFKVNIAESLLHMSASIFGFVALIGTFSRSAWISTFVTVVLLSASVFFKKERKSLVKPTIVLVGAMMLLTTFFLPIVMVRVETFGQVFSIGSGRVRIDLIKEAFVMIRSFPIFGVGLNHFTRIMSLRDLPPELRGFMFPVHNTFLLFFSELGIPAGLSFVVIVVHGLIRSFKQALKNIENFGVWLSVLSFIFINGQFHTLFSQDPSFELLMILLGFLATI